MKPLVVVLASPSFSSGEHGTTDPPAQPMGWFLSQALAEGSPSEAFGHLLQPFANPGLGGSLMRPSKSSVTV